ncbi:cytochrome P450 [Kineosporia sp. R_H_3]|uniref:cytochrome P450 n=1 Tax=Kineosporia sp. R_H_3 TaxID=1961848 RepID=UPI000B4C10C5|nr:cytochrome P450 [Kineosporia sp. R_H_3]
MTTTPVAPSGAAADTDLSDLDLFAQTTPWAAFDSLRRDEPVHFNPEQGGNKGFWSITRHADIVNVSRDEETFSSEVAAVNLEELDSDQLEIRKSMLETDGARHFALRRLLQRDFSARALAPYETFLRGLTATTLDAALGKAKAEGGIDFVKEVSADFPIRVLVRLLGVPDDHAWQLIRWGNRMVGNTDPDEADVLLDSPESEQYRNLPFRSPAALEVFAYGDELARQRRGGDGEDLVSKLVNRVPEDGIPLSERDFHNYFLLLVVAGNETTRHTITHSMKALIDHPEAFAALKERPELLPKAVEEFLRWASPVYHFRRTATKDVELHGRTIAAGDKVVMWWASGNRDESVFADPYRFDVERDAREHMAFGKGGPHLCLGNQLARMEIRIMFEEILRRVDSAKELEPPKRVRSNFVNGFKEYWVQVQGS